MTASEPTSSAAGDAADQHGARATPDPANPANAQPGPGPGTMAAGAFAITAAQALQPADEVGQAGGHVLYSAAYSHYARRVLQARPDLPAVLAAAATQPLTRAWMQARLQALHEPSADAEESAKRTLRRLRAEVMCAVIERDLRGLATLGEVTSAMTDLAELAIQHGLAMLGDDLAATFGRPVGAHSGEVQELVVVGMGKLGGRELNVSSDIDLIFLYDEDGETQGGSRSLSNHEYFIRLGRRLINLLAEVTADGYVFRVDMRLRPNGDAGPLACSLGMLEEYLVVQGREWERYAWIKGRVVSALDTPHAQRTASLLSRLTTPFVFRRYLDYGVIAAIRSLHAQIRSEAAKRSGGLAGHGVNQRSFNIKLGRGGIREIEFMAQVFQLIRGGQDPVLRVRPTLEVLAVAVERGLLPAGQAEQLGDAYRFLRQLEHRLQYRDDAQTHHLPTSPEEQLAVARMMGCADWQELLARLAALQEPVAQQFEATFSDPDAAPCEALWPGIVFDDNAAQAQDNPEQKQDDAACDDDAAPCQRLQAAGFTDCTGLLDRLRAIASSLRYRALSESSRARFDQLVNRALDLAARQEDADSTIARFIDFLEAISRRASYLSLLSEYPQAMDRVAQTLHASRWAAAYLTRHPQLLDELLDSDALAGAPDWAAFRKRLHERLLAAEGQIEQQMDILRREHHVETFRVLLQDLQGMLTVEQVADRLSDLADAMLEATLATVWRQLATRHRDTPRFAVIAYGRLGGKELGYASDLDIIFLYDDDHERAPDVYAAYARRLITWLTSHTAAGALFDVDTRLRPNGAAGLLVTSFEAFRRYQLREGDNTAWVWEHQALTRARFCAGDAAIGDRFEALRGEVLCQDRDAAALRDEIVQMRRKVAEGHPNPTDLFDLKHDRGGMVDIEFTVQYLVLLHSRAHPQLTRNAGNIALLREAGELGLIDATLALAVGDAYRLFRARQHQLRLEGQAHARVAPASVAQQTGQVRALWQAVFGEA
ncbi:bifunctional [glutamate--ammonia ligase]-adenylyl-L-tyrosine phosphorylase/[glutamate--ammonia-ligase] adenylyltransferase [Cupriavidus necator]|uniref:Bifunctional glutamine synthetase adenylyltransferase/adenylyl-removing enzyme n=1 Tax=Cupriavidus necator TaxID=106590 RepID=A0A367PG83_CUPNE|nr:bifunctional [glutamate--ammonia ligase]-adenylyl-L-tyrosine phosphorylase/[glutamate--ammonia-ligase] adenylyltransferase [Cupriavidus necator]QQX85436.1 bifunctional [glutamate--ammonia ligase]-adenylyl-L-tyrosine phosphorylase/[glutamate--ammonia-ligase] adenylyltransferase [Cupriavidus necator]RCJ05996.1 bifunctional [glutamate--ammonia ligase]-adenylyl-L-tyrosine phosphorylase/[glutamate--ammonia-ligase] adenylyltransferase [Cupriavidus necator]